MTACEVDIYGALTMLIQKPGFTRAKWRRISSIGRIQHQEFKIRSLPGIAGNGRIIILQRLQPISIPTASSVPRWVKKNSMGTGEFELKPGVVTLCRLQEYKGKFKMLVTKAPSLSQTS